MVWQPLSVNSLCGVLQETRRPTKQQERCWKCKSMFHVHSDLRSVVIPYPLQLLLISVISQLFIHVPKTDTIGGQ